MGGYVSKADPVVVQATAGHVPWAGEGRLYSCVSGLILELHAYEDFGKTEPYTMNESESE